MTIKQQGGIFGRNPTFNDVTIEGALTFDGDIDVNSDLKLDGDLDVTGLSNLNGGLEVSRSGNGDIVTLQKNEVEVGSIATSASALIVQSTACGLWFNNTSLVIPTNGSSGGTNGEMSLGQSGNRFKELYLTENVYVGSGSGIDFSATSGTGTSELFDDYEEGTWTPTLTTDGTDFTSVTYDGITSGSYTKVGNLVHVQFTFRTDAVTVGSASGSVRLGGLPFTAKTGNGGLATLSISSSASWSGEQPSAILIISGTNAGNFVYRTAADGALSNTAVADVNTGSDANLIRASGTYLV